MDMNRSVIGIVGLFALMVVSLIVGLAGAAPGLLMVSLLCIWPVLSFVLGRFSTQYTFRAVAKSEVSLAPPSSRRRAVASQDQSLY